MVPDGSDVIDERPRVCCFGTNENADRLRKAVIVAINKEDSTLDDCDASKTDHEHHPTRDCQICQQADANRDARLSAQDRNDTRRAK